MTKALKNPPFAALVILLVSWLIIRAGIFAGERVIQPGEGYRQSTGIQTDLFRFDAEYYFTIATDGYSYSGDPSSSPNIVFAPLYPALIWLASWLPALDEVRAGFLLNKLFLFLSIVFLFQYFSRWLGEKRAFLTLIMMATAAGAYSFHAYYSESTMLLALSVILLAQQRQNFPLMAIAAAAIGASRTAALPIVLITSSFLLVQAKRPLLALLSIAGSTAYLGYIAWNFGNPFTLLPQIQFASWNYFHPEVPWHTFLTALFEYSWAALQKGWITLIDIKTLNLAWTLLALVSVGYSVKRFGLTFFTALFTAYFVFIYLTGAGSDFLISAHRFYVLMLPIFVMASAANWTIAGLVIVTNIFYCLLHTAFFNQGIWFYF